MHILIRDYKNHSEHNFLLLFSLLLVVLGFYAAVYNSKYITISPIPSSTLIIKEKVLSVVITAEKIVKKQIQKPTRKKPIVKKQTVKKSIVKKVLKQRVVEQEIIQELLPVKTEPVKFAESKPAVPIFDASMKASFISGLYTLFNENKFYPKMAKRRNLEGIVSICFTLCKDGEIKNVFISKSCGHKILDKAALKVVKSIDFYKSIPDAVSMASLNLNIPIKYSKG